jgi:glycosyltransferase involved in cell wall biosynthesis
VFVHVVTNGTVSWSGFAFHQEPWSKEKESKQIASFDIGLVPLVEDDQFAAGKSSYKLLQFLAAGLPTISSPVGFSKEVIKPGLNGLAAGTTEEWIVALEQLIESEKLRRQIADAARETVEVEFSLERIARRWVKIVSGRDLPSEEMKGGVTGSNPVEA